MARVLPYLVIIITLYSLGNCVIVDDTDTSRNIDSDSDSDTDDSALRNEIPTTAAYVTPSVKITTTEGSITISSCTFIFYIELSSPANSTTVQGLFDSIWFDGVYSVNSSVDVDYEYEFIKSDIIRQTDEEPDITMWYQIVYSTSESELDCAYLRQDLDSQIFDFFFDGGLSDFEGELNELVTFISYGVYGTDMCYETTDYYEEIVYSWSDTEYGYRAGSTETCSNNTAREGVSLAYKDCNRLVSSSTSAVTWTNNIYVTDCNMTLNELSEITVTTDNAETIAIDLALLSEDIDSAETIEICVQVLQSISYITNLNQTILSEILIVINNLLEADGISVDNGESIVNAVEYIIDHIDTSDGTLVIGVDSVAVGLVLLKDVNTEDGVEFSLSSEATSSWQSDDLRIGSGNSPTDSLISLSLSSEFIDVVLDECSSNTNPPVVAFTLYRNETFFYDGSQTSDSSNTVGSYIIGATLFNCEVEPVEDTVKGSFTLQEDPSSDGNDDNNAYYCVYWDFDSDVWSSDGCRVSDILYENDDIIVSCSCDHLTNFALLVDDSATGADTIALSVITYIGCVLSVIGLLITILSLTLIKSLRERRANQILLNLCVAILLSVLLFMVGVERTEYTGVCVTIAMVLHYLLLASFCWMIVESVNMYLSFVIVMGTHIGHFMLKAALFAWGLPLVIVVITAALNINYYGTGVSSPICWINSPAVYYAFLLPVALAILINLIAFIFIIKSLVVRNRNKSTMSTSVGKQSVHTQLRIAVAILSLMGLTWVFAYLILTGLIVFHYLFAITNTLQGFVIFIFYCARQSDVRDYWLKFFGYHEGQKHKITKRMEQKTTPFTKSSTDDKVTDESRTRSTSGGGQSEEQGFDNIIPMSREEIPTSV